MTAVPERLLLIGAFAALYLIWGSTYLAIRFGVASWPPLLFTAVRFLLAGSLLYGWLRWRGVKSPTAQEWRSAALLGVLLLGCGTGGVTVAESLGATSGIAAMMVATMPLFTVVFGYLWSQRASALEWAGIFLGLFGIALLNRGANLQAAPLAAMLLLLAPAGWALGSVWGRYLAQPAGIMSSASQMLAGGSALLLASVLTGERPWDRLSLDRGAMSETGFLQALHDGLDKFELRKRRLGDDFRGHGLMCHKATKNTGKRVVDEAAELRWLDGLDPAEGLQG